MAFEPKSFATIFKQMRDRTPGSLTDFQEGSVVRTLYESFAWELALLYEQMHQVYLSAYIDTAAAEQLDLVVAVLGMKRGEPDFATGMVDFERDIGIDQEIDIPIGTLVTTEDTEKSPKKAYETIEAKTIPQDQKAVTVRIQALKRGETEVTEAGTIQVMPQPMPGVKFVKNAKAIRFTGKGRETDQELRDRAKKALLASSGANATSIENALLSLPGVKEVKVREGFHFARGKVTLTGTAESGTTKIPKKTKLYPIKGSNSFETTEEVSLNGNNPVEVTVQALISGVAGQVTEVNASWETLKLPNSTTFTVNNAEPIMLREFGAIEVFVDGINFTDEKKVNELKQEIDRVRAAGIYVLLKPANPVTVDGVFQIELTPGLKQSAEEPAKVENQVREAIKSHITEQRMGQPLLISQLTKKILELNEVNDLVNFTLTTKREIEQPQQYKPSEKPVKRLDVDVFEKFTPRYIRVASDRKPLPVDVQVKAQELDNTKQEAILAALKEYFEPSRGEVQQEVQQREIEQKIGSSISSEVKVKLIPHFWQPNSPFNGENFPVSFVEQLQLGNIFIYDKILEIRGAFQLTLPPEATGEQKQDIQGKVRSELDAYLESLKPEENVNIKELEQKAKTVDSVLGIEWKLDDFQLRLDGQEVTGRIDNNQIRVDKFEKAKLAEDFVIASDIQPVAIKIAALTLRLDVTGQLPQDREEREKLNTAMKEAVKGIFGRQFDEQLRLFLVEQNLNYEQFKANVPIIINNLVRDLSRERIQEIISEKEEIPQLADLTKNLLRSANYTIEKLELERNNQKLLPGQDISIRLVEQVKLQPISKETIEIKIEMPLSRN